MFNISIDTIERNNNSSLFHTSDIGSEKGNNSCVSGALNQFDQYSQISENPNNFNALKEKEDCKTNTVKNEGKNKKNEIIENEKQSIKNEESEDESKSPKNEESNRNVEQEDLNLPIIRVLKRILEIIKEEKIINETLLFTTIDSLTSFYQQAFVEEFQKGNLSNNKLNDSMKILGKMNLLDEIKDLKTKQINGNTMSTSDISYLQAKIILSEETDGNNDIKNKIKIEAGDNAKPMEALNIAIKIFIINCVEEKIKYLNEKCNEIKPEKEEIKSLGKKRNTTENDDEEEIENKNHMDRHSNIPRARHDNILNMLNRNLIQTILLNWINYEESDKNKILIKLDPIIFRNNKDFYGKKLKEIYSQKISIKEKNIDKNHNINIINGANGIKSVKLNFTFLQALKLFYYKSNKTELLKIINNLQETEKIGNETDILKGLIGKEEYLAEKEKKRGALFKEKLEKHLIKIEEKYLTKK